VAYDHFCSRNIIIFIVIIILCLVENFSTAAQQKQVRIRDLGIKIGILAPGPLNAITDVSGVKVGHVTLIRGDNIRTGVTAILPHAGNLFQDKVPGAVFIGNAFGKLIGSTQVNELGEIETPILLTSTLSAPKVADALISYMLNLQGNEKVLSINPLVGETNDGILNDIRSRPITQEDVFTAITSAKNGMVKEGAVGAGTGTVAFGFKGGIGTASRRIPENLGGYTVGVLVQSNFGGVLSIAGVPIAKELDPAYLQKSNKTKTLASLKKTSDGSIMIIVATDAPLDHRNLNRLASRAMLGLGRTGSNESNGSGDFVIAFSTAKEIRIHAANNGIYTAKMLSNDSMTPLFEAVIEATEEAIYNSMLMAEDMSGNGHTVKALPQKEVIALLKKHNVILSDE
jgi:D-aminopeptidase